MRICKPEMIRNKAKYCMKDILAIFKSAMPITNLSLLFDVNYSLKWSQGFI